MRQAYEQGSRASSYGAKVMTFECGMRFLTDYLEGDHYFKIHRENHNLDRMPYPVYTGKRHGEKMGYNERNRKKVQK